MNEFTDSMSGDSISEEKYKQLQELEQYKGSIQWRIDGITKMFMTMGPESLHELENTLREIDEKIARLKNSNK